jgi:hypothetical protein
MKLAGALIVACAFVFTATATAQEKPTAKPAAKEHTMTGCLQKGSAPDSWVVANTDPKGPKLIGIVSAKEKLAAHAGHKMDFTGTAVPNAEAEKMKGTPKADHYMHITATKMISTTCP